MGEVKKFIPENLVLTYPEHAAKDLRCKSLTKAPQGADGGRYPVPRQRRGYDRMSMLSRKTL